MLLEPLLLLLSRHCASFPVFLVFLSSFRAVGRSVPVGGLVVDEHLVEALERLGQVVLQRGERGADGRRAEAVRDEAEVRQTALDARLQDGRRTRVPERSAVLRQEVCELLTQLPECRRDTQREKKGLTVIKRNIS